MHACGRVLVPRQSSGQDSSVHSCLRDKALALRFYDALRHRPRQICIGSSDELATAYSERFDRPDLRAIERYKREDHYLRYSAFYRYKRHALPLVIERSSRPSRQIENLRHRTNNRYKPQSLTLLTLVWATCVENRGFVGRRSPSGTSLNP